MIRRWISNIGWVLKTPNGLSWFSHNDQWFWTFYCGLRLGKFLTRVQFKYQKKEQNV